MHNILLALLFQVLGVAVIIAEFFIPSGGLLSVLSLGLLGYSLYIVFTQVSVGVGYMFVAADAILIPVIVIYGIRLIARSKASLRTELTSKSGVISQSEELATFAGKEGVTVTHLHPSGIALIDGKRVDVVTGGEFITRNTPVEVAAVTGNQVVVRKKTE